VNAGARFPGQRTAAQVMGLPAEKHQHERVQCAFLLGGLDSQSFVVQHLYYACTGFCGKKCDLSGLGSWCYSLLTTAHSSSTVCCCCAVLLAPIVVAALLGVLQALISRLLAANGSVRSADSPGSQSRHTCFLYV
jgi:hypothetical protein